MSKLRGPSSKALIGGHQHQGPGQAVDVVHELAEQLVVIHRHGSRVVANAVPGIAGERDAAVVEQDHRPGVPRIADPAQRGLD